MFLPSVKLIKDVLVRIKARTISTTGTIGITWTVPCVPPMDNPIHNSEPNGAHENVRAP